MTHRYFMWLVREVLVGCFWVLRSRSYKDIESGMILFRLIKQNSSQLIGNVSSSKMCDAPKTRESVIANKKRVSFRSATGAVSTPAFLKSE